MLKSPQESFEEFGAMRDAWLMLEGLNDLDPFVGRPPCYAHDPIGGPREGEAVSTI
jgi:hypothetical protein